MSDRPNVIFLFSDQQRWDTVSCYGRPLASKFNLTPNLDRLAAEGTQFNNAFSCQPVCGPARAALQSGRWPTEVHCQTNNMPLPAHEARLAPTFSAGGYEVGYIGKWHLASGGPVDWSKLGRGEQNSSDDYKVLPIPFERRGGFKDFWIASDVLEFTSHGYGGHMFDANGQKVEWPEDVYRADFQTDLVLEYLDSRLRNRPFFLMVSYIEPHHQNDRNTHEAPHGLAEQLAELDPPGDLLDTEGNWREELANYLGCCKSLDDNVGRIMKKLDDLGEAENTVIVYTSDHGSHFRTRNPEYKRSCHDASIHIPMIAWGPGFQGGSQVNAPVSLMDIPPTLVTAAGLEPPAAFRGRALQPLATNPDADWPDHVFLQISESHIGRALRTSRWTYEIAAPRNEANVYKGQIEAPFATTYYEAFLYDNQADPHQKQNLAADPTHAETRARFNELLLNWIVEIGEPKPEIRPAGECPATF